MRSVTTARGRTNRLCLGFRLGSGCSCRVPHVGEAWKLTGKEFQFTGIVLQVDAEAVSGVLLAQLQHLVGPDALRNESSASLGMSCAFLASSSARSCA